jgi:hypothetical protein
MPDLQQLFLCLVVRLADLAANVPPYCANVEEFRCLLAGREIAVK